MSRAIRLDGEQGAGNGEPATPRPAGICFSSPAAFFAALLGPPQHDAHVERWRGESWLRARREGSARGLAAVDDLVGELREHEAQRLAAAHGYDTAALSREFHRFDSGCFSRQPFARTRARRLRRAIEIACARRDDEIEAAE
jgi:hypothetical protein